MPPSRPAILLTRPRRQAERFAESLRERLGDGAEILISPLIEIEFIPDPAPIPDGAGLIFTSENGVLAFAQEKQAKGRVAWCVGPRTGEVAKSAGFDVRIGGGDAGRLAEAIIAAGPAGPLIHYRGRHARGDIAARLRAAGLEAEERIAYRQKPLSLAPEARRRLEGERQVLVPLFSPRSAALFVGEAGDAEQTSLCMIAMSKAVAEVARGAGLDVAAVVREPNAEAMIAAIAGLLDA